MNGARQEGREEGLEKGREEGLEIAARAMKLKGMAVAQIVEITGLDEAAIESLK